MTTFDDREKAEELRYAKTEELTFKARARRNKLVGLWAAGHLGLAGQAAEDYAASVVAADLEAPGDEDVIAKLLADLAPKGIAEHTIRHELGDQMTIALEQIRKSG